MKKGTAEWVRKAEDDFLTAQDLLALKPLHKDQIGFCCQQAIEKYLKAVLYELGIAVPKTHDIPRLIGLIRPPDLALSALRRGTQTITRFAVEYRYPGLKTSARQARRAFEKAARFRLAIRKRLGLRMRRGR